jgi:hypothetical protein
MRPNVLMLMLLDNEEDPIMLAPPHRMRPIMLKPLPQRTAARIETVEPKLMNSSEDTEPPILPVLLRLIALPNWQHETTLS